MDAGSWDPASFRMRNASASAAAARAASRSANVPTIANVCSTSFRTRAQASPEPTSATRIARASRGRFRAFSDSDRNILACASADDPERNRLTRASDEQLQQVLGRLDRAAIELQDQVSY